MRLIRAFVLAIFLAALQALAQHPALSFSALSQNYRIAAFDAAGNSYSFSTTTFSGTNASPAAALTKFAPDGSLVFTKPLAYFLTNVVIDSSGNFYAEATCVDDGWPQCPSGIAPNRTFGTNTSASPIRHRIVKFGPTGDIVWVDEIANVQFFLGIHTLAVDAGGNVHLAGFGTCDLPVTPGAFQTDCVPIATGSVTSSFVAEIDSTGSKLLYLSFLHGSLSPTPEVTTVVSVAADVDGGTILTGYGPPSWPTTPGAFEPVGTSVLNSPFMAKLSPSGSVLVYSTFLNEVVDSTTIASVDSSGRAWLVASTTKTNLPTTPNVINPTPPGDIGAGARVGVALQFNGQGSLLGATYLNLFTDIADFTLDAAGNAYLVGSTARAGTATVNAIQNEFAGGTDVAIAKLKPDLSAYLFATYLGSTATDSADRNGSRIALTTDGSISFAGNTWQSKFPANNLLGADTAANAIFFVARISPSGGAVPIIVPTQDSDTLDFPGPLPQQFQFGQTQIGTSQSAVLWVGNYGGAPMTVSSISTSGDYSQTSDCIGIVQPGTHCIVRVTFAPTAAGVRSGDLVVVTNSTTIRGSLGGVGGGAGLSVTPTSLTFPALPAGTTSDPQTITVTNPGNAPLIPAINAPPLFRETDNCTPSVAPGQSCTIQVRYFAYYPASKDTLTIVSGTSNQVATVALSGGGGLPNFSIGTAAGSSAVQSVTAGQAVTYAQILTPAAGFSGTVTLACSGAPAFATCTVAPSSVNLSGSTVATFNVTVSTMARSSVAAAGIGLTPFREDGPSRTWAETVYGMAFFALCLALRKRRLPARAVALSAVAACLIFGLAACGGGSPAPPKTPVVTGTPAGTYTLVITATSGQTINTQNLSLTVN